MSYMFSESIKLTTIGNISKWNTSKVINVYGMFSYASNLTTLDLSNWDTSSVTSMSYMF